MEICDFIRLVWGNYECISQNTSISECKTKNLSLYIEIEIEIQVQPKNEEGVARAVFQKWDVLLC